jgi:hypothetical protein
MTLILPQDHLVGNGSNRNNGSILDLTVVPGLGKVGITVFLPLNDNNSRPFAFETLQGAINKIVESFGGATVLPPSHGYWISNGEMFRDWVSPVQVIAPNTRETVTTCVAIANELAAHLEQYEIFMNLTPTALITDPVLMDGLILEGGGKELLIE